MTVERSVMLVDDHAVVRTGYRMLLERTGEFMVVGEAGSGEDALRDYSILNPDLVIMDINLPGISGIEATRCIKRMDPQARILVFSIHDETIYASRAFEAGASAYLSKDSSPDEMIETARRMFTGNSEAQDRSKDVRPLAIRTQINPLSELTQRELEVFLLLGKGSDSREIARTLNLSTKTVSNYIVLIKEKLHADSTADLIRRATFFT